MQIYSVLVSAVMRSGKSREMIELFSRLHRGEPASPEWIRLRAYGYFAAGRYDESLRDFTRARRLGDRSADSFYKSALMHTWRDKPRLAAALLSRALAIEPANPLIMYELAHRCVECGDERKGVEVFRQLVKTDPRYAMPHQNYAAKIVPEHYVPQLLDLHAPDAAYLYDMANRVAESLIQRGDGSRSHKHYERALAFQTQCRGDLDIPVEIRLALQDRYGVEVDQPFAILPPEWNTQIGHQAYLDAFLRMRATGLVNAGHPLVVTPRNMIANGYLFDRYNGRHFTHVDDPELIRRLLPYQRSLGCSFNAWRRPDGRVVSWCEGAVAAYREWEKAGRGSLVELPPEDVEAGHRTLRAMGLPEGAWWAALHVREGGWHREAGDSNQRHRNTNVEDYFPAIEEITSRGGWVVRLGDKSMTPLPRMAGVIDYAVSELKSPQMDVFLCARARCFIGSTSGLTNLPIILDTPALVVNSISNYFQVWSSKVQYSLKSIHDAAGDPVPLSTLIDEEFCWRIFDANRLLRDGYTFVDNTPDDIRAFVASMLDDIDAQARPDHQLDRPWSSALRTRPFFGLASPNRAFLDRYGERLLPEPRPRRRAAARVESQDEVMLGAAALARA